MDITKELIKKNKALKLIYIFSVRKIREFETQLFLKEVTYEKMDFQTVLINETQKPIMPIKLKRNNTNQSEPSKDVRNIDLMANILETVKGFSLFQKMQKLSHNDMKKIARFIKYEFYPKNSYIFRQGDYAMKFYGIIRGKVEILETKFIDKTKDIRTYLHEKTSVNANNQETNNNNSSANNVNNNISNNNNINSNNVNNNNNNEEEDAITVIEEPKFLDEVSYFLSSGSQSSNETGKFICHEIEYNPDSSFKNEEKKVKSKSVSNNLVIPLNGFTKSHCNIKIFDSKSEEGQFYSLFKNLHELKKDCHYKKKIRSNSYPIKSTMSYKFTSLMLALFKASLTENKNKESKLIRQKRKLTTKIINIETSSNENDEKNEKNPAKKRESVKSTSKRNSVIRRPSKKKTDFKLSYPVFKLVTDLQFCTSKLTDGNFFGDEDMIKKERRIHSAICLEDSDIFSLSKEYFDKYILDKIVRTEIAKNNFISKKLKILKEDKRFITLIPNIKGMYLLKGQIIYTPFDQANEVYLVYQGECALANSRRKYLSKEELLLDNADMNIEILLGPGGFGGLEAYQRNVNYQKYFIVSSYAAVVYKLKVKDYDEVTQKFRNYLKNLYDQEKKSHEILKDKEQSFKEGRKKNMKKEKKIKLRNSLKKSHIYLDVVDKNKKDFLAEKKNVNYMNLNLNMNNQEKAINIMNLIKNNKNILQINKNKYKKNNVEIKKDINNNNANLFISTNCYLSKYNKDPNSNRKKNIIDLTSKEFFSKNIYQCAQIPRSVEKKKENNNYDQYNPYKCNTVNKKIKEMDNEIFSSVNVKYKEKINKGSHSQNFMDLMKSFNSGMKINKNNNIANINYIKTDGNTNRRVFSLDIKNNNSNLLGKSLPIASKKENRETPIRTFMNNPNLKSILCEGDKFPIIKK